MPSAASRRLEPRLPTPRVYRNTRRGDPRPSLAQWVLLSMLLHAFFILLFGSPAGGSKEGRAAWGRLDVTIRGPLLDSGVGRDADRGADLRLPGTELLERRDRKREAANPPTPESPPEPPRPQPDLAAPRISDMPVPAPLAPITSPTADLVPAPRVEPLKADVPVIAVPAIDWTPRQAVEPSLSPPVDIPQPVRVPVIPAPSLQESGAPAASPRLAPTVDIAPIRAPAPAIAAPALQESGTPAVTPRLAPPVQIAPIAAPAPAIPAPAQPASVETPVIAAPPMQHTPVPVTTPSLAPSVEVAPLRPTAPSAASPAPGTTARDAARARPAAPDDAAPSPRDSPIFNNRRQVPPDTPIPGTEPRIDLDAARARAREVAREGTGNRALLPFPMPPVPERKTKEQIAIEKSLKPECKDAYKGLGLLAVVPLIANEFGEGNCRW